MIAVCRRCSATFTGDVADVMDRAAAHEAECSHEHDEDRTSIMTTHERSGWSLT